MIEVVHLRRLRAWELEDLLDEEIAAWRETFEWDFGSSAELVKRFVGQQALSGYALVEGRSAIGYSYFVQDEHKGLIGDLYLRKPHRSVENENRLLEATIEELFQTPGVHRVETQLMMLLSPHRRLLPGHRYLSAFDRCFVRFDWTDAATLRPSLQAQERVRLETWDDRHHEQAAHLIADCYQDHIDAQINDQYRSVAGARKFLHNITQYPGCGTFYKPGSYLAFDRAGGDLGGLSLASLVRHDVGHITQICVGKRWRGLGIGYELLRNSLCDLRAAGCRKVTLTVTAANREALELYERLGFTNVRNFCAYVWEGFRP